QGSGSGNYGILVDRLAVVEGGSGNVTLTGQAPGDTAAITFPASDIGARLQAGMGDATLRGDVIDLGDPGSVSGSGRLFLQPYTASRPIRLGGTSDAPGHLTITSADAAAIAPGLILLTIGVPVTGSGDVTSGGDLAFSSDVAVATPANAGNGISLGNKLDV